MSRGDRMVSLRSTVSTPCGRFGSNLQVRPDATLQKQNSPLGGPLCFCSGDRMVSLRSTVSTPYGRYGSNLQARLDATLQKQNSPLGGAALLL